MLLGGLPPPSCRERDRSAPDDAEVDPGADAAAVVAGDRDVAPPVSAPFDRDRGDERAAQARARASDAPRAVVGAPDAQHDVDAVREALPAEHERPARGHAAVLDAQRRPRVVMVVAGDGGADGARATGRRDGGREHQRVRRPPTSSRPDRP